MRKLFPTYHDWFDEGVAQYVSGEVGEVIKDGRFDRDIEKLKTNADAYWSGVTSVSSVNHRIGLITKTYNMTAEQNRMALAGLHRRYLQKGQEISKRDIEEEYERALGVSLDPIFDFLRSGVVRLYALFNSAQNERVLAVV